MVASRREAAITALMSVPDRPGVWTDLVIDNAGLLSTGDYDCYQSRRWFTADCALSSCHKLPLQATPSSLTAGSHLCMSKWLLQGAVGCFH